MNTQRFNVTSLVKQQPRSSTSTNVKVVVRVRPPNEREIMSGKTNLIRITDDYMLTFDPKEEDIYNMNKSKRFSVLDKRIRDLQFAFDHVFSDESNNEEVFEHTTKPLIHSLLKGYNCSVFAYGATSAGKTHTMLGSQEKPGVIFLTMMELYKRLMDNADGYDGDISVSYLEIYNETCKDLLLPKGPLAVREDPDKGVCVNGLSLHKPRSPDELLEMLHFGNQNRTQHPTDANRQSSRSHAVFQVFVRQCPKGAGLSANVKLSKMSLIDLAGSERATVTTNCGDRLREGANINKSLLALGNCINALADNNSKMHIPYRNSKLTRLLKDSLGGNCKTVMIAAVSPSHQSYEDTYNTLKYANRAKNIKSSLTANTVQVDYHVSQYGKIVEDLKAEISSLKEKIQVLENKTPEMQNFKMEETLETLKTYEQQIRGLFKEKELFKCQFVECESTEKELALKLICKERNFEHLNKLVDVVGEVLVKESQTKLHDFRSSTLTRHIQLKEQKPMLLASMEENSKLIFCLQEEVREWSSNKNMSIKMQLNYIFESCKQHVDNVTLRAKNKHVRKCFLMRDAHSKTLESMVTLLIANQKSPSKSSVLLEDFPQLDDTKISWADQTLGDENKILADINTPFKTPSKKPGILRRIIMQSRSKVNKSNIREHRSDAVGGKSTETVSDETSMNTVTNKGFVRIAFPSSYDATNARINFSPVNEEKISFNAISNQSVDGVSQRLTYTCTDSENLSKPSKDALSQRLKFHDDCNENTKSADRKSDVGETTFGITSMSSQSMKDNILGSSQDLGETSAIKSSNKSNIPVRTPLKQINDKLLKNLFSVKKSDNLNDTFTVEKETLSRKSTVKNLFKPTLINSRTNSMLNKRYQSSFDIRKENIQPTSNFKKPPTKIKAAKSCTNLSSGSKKGFRF